MTTALAERDDTAILEQVLVNGDLSRLSGSDRLAYYRKVCESLGLNPLTKPFDYITLNGKLTLYANRTCTEQLREKREVSTVLTDKRFEEGLYIVTAKATLPNGRTDESTGAVPIDKLTGEARANAIMKAETKAKRRVTLSIVGLGWLDESEVDSIADARRVRVNQDGEIVEPEHYVQREPIPPPAEGVIDANRASQGLTQSGAASRNRPQPMPPPQPKNNGDASTRFWAVAKKRGSSWYEPLLQTNFGSTDFALLNDDEKLRAAELVEAQDAK